MDTLIFIGILSFALMAGVYFTFSTFVMRSLNALPDAEGMRAMQSINDIILRSAFMVLFFGTSLLSLFFTLHRLIGFDAYANDHLVMLSGIVYFVGMFLCTVFFNVPLNNALKEANSESDSGVDVWQHYVARWTKWNHVRTLCCTAASASLLYAIV